MRPTASPTISAQWINRGQRLQQEGRYEDALAAYEQAQSLAPQDATLYAIKADVLVELQREQEALVAYARALRLYPHFASVYNNLGVLLAEMQYYKEAILAFERAIQLAPDEVLIYRNLSLLLESLGRWREALSIQMRAGAHDTQSEGAGIPETPNPQAHAMTGQDMPALQHPALWLL